jgi:ketosteroid isomerase-like protein
MAPPGCHRWGSKSKKGEGVPVTSKIAIGVLVAGLVALVGAGWIAAESRAGSDEGVPTAFEEISKLPITYSVGYDEKDIDGIMSAFSENAEYDLSAFDFPNVVGKAALRGFFSGVLFAVEESSRSQIMNIKVDIHGDTATGIDYFQHVGHTTEYHPLVCTRAYTEGVHFYEFVKEDGAWKISYLRGSGTYQEEKDIACEDMPPRVFPIQSALTVES